MAAILFTSPSSGITDEVGRALPDAAIMRIGTALPDSLPAGKVWCFVDWLLPETSGLEVCRRLRAAPVMEHAHITLVLESDDDMAKRRALSAGADDYMLGPLTAERVVARLVEQKDDLAAREPSLTHAGDGSLTLDAESHQVRWKGKLVVLRPREISLLAAFLRNPDRLLSRSRLIALAGNACDIHDERTVDVWVGRLRRSLEAQGVPGMVRTVRSHGYVLDTPDLSR